MKFVILTTQFDQTQKKNPMKRLRILQVAFDTQIQPYQLSAFRGAIARKVGLEHEWFHNHDNENGGFHNRYPLIQYKLDTYQGLMRPMLFCLEDGIEEAHQLFSQPEWSVNIKGTHHDLRIAKLNVHQYTVNTWDTPFSYRIHKWQAFNADAYHDYQQKESLVERFSFLEQRLATHIGSFGTGIGWDNDRPIEVKITNFCKPEWLDYKRIKVLTFTMDFKTNVSLPDFIGLGKGASRGLGVVKRLKIHQKTEKYA
jgi:hypothetical protein